MEKCLDLESKYHKLATEYSKIRSQAVVLKKAVIDEQARNLELKDLMKKQEQQIRKHDQEMESLTFRNEQLTKRIFFLQTELQANCTNKKYKNKLSENVTCSNSTILDEELQKKILENAQLASRMADKDFELSDYREKVEWLEGKVASLQRVISDLEEKCKDDAVQLKNQKYYLDRPTTDDICLLQHEDFHENHKQVVVEEIYWKEEAARWKEECEVLRCKPNSHDKLTQYYESQISDLLETKQLVCSEARSLWAENLALNSHLEQLIMENKHLENCLAKSNEELLTTTENYKTQLDAMTEHLAAQNEKITKQCDEIQLLKHKLMQKNKSH